MAHSSRLITRLGARAEALHIEMDQANKFSLKQKGHSKVSAGMWHPLPLYLELVLYYDQDSDGEVRQDNMVA